MLYNVISQLAKRTGGKPLGLLMILSGLFLNQWSLGQILAFDRHIDNWLAVTIIALVQGCLLCAGGCLLWKSPHRHWPWLIRSLLGLGCTTTILFGAYGMGLWWQGTQPPPVRDIAALCRWLSAGQAPYLGTALIDRLSVDLAQKAAEPSPEVTLLHRRLGHYLLQVGRIPEALHHFHSAYKLATSQDMSNDTINALRYWIGVAYLRQGEVDNCQNQHNPERCIFPIAKGGMWTATYGALTAIEYFEALLRDQPDHLSARWLLNIAHMAAGSYPDGLAPKMRIAPRTLQSEGQVRRFRDVAPALGLDAFNLLGGAIMDDFDNDGFLDIITSTWHPCEPMQYQHNNGDGTFSDWTDRARLTNQVGIFNLVQADYNNDGLLDIFALRGAWMGAKFGRQRNSLLRQNPDGTFTDVTMASGLGDTAYPCLSAAWADYDLDGDLDLYVGNERFPSELFRNNGDGTFTDVAQQAGVDNQMATAKGITWGDYDNDGDPDLYVSNFPGPNRLYRNNGNHTFTDVAPELGVHRTKPHRQYTFATWFWDVDNNGWLDLFVAGYNATLDAIAADYLAQPATGERLWLFRNDGTGHFADASQAMHLDRILLPMGANYGDIDNDGFL